MRLLLITIIILLQSTVVTSAKPMSVLDIREQQGSIAAHFSLSGTTVIVNEAGQPQISPVDRLQATLRVTSPETYTVALPTFSGTTFGDFTLIDQTKVRRIRTHHYQTTTSWLIEPYNPGEYTLPTLMITAAGKDGSKQTLSLNLPPLTITATPAVANDFDILPPRQVKQTTHWPRIIAMVTGGVILLVFLFWYFKEKKQSRPLSPKKLALQRLASITGSNKEKTAALSLTTRQFIDANFKLCTTEKTHEEYAPYLKKHPHMHNSTEILALLQRCDLNNYRADNLNDDEFSQMIQQAKTIIKDSGEPLRANEDDGTCGRW